MGVAYSMGGTQNGLSLELSANRGNGRAYGNSATYSNSHFSAGTTVKLQSGGDTNIKGGVVSAANVVADIGGNLNVQSLQDKVVYDSKQTSAGVSVSVCLPPACYGTSTRSGSYSKAAVNGDFLSVVEQSGIKAGDGGFQLVVHGNTDLIGAVISSSQGAIDQGKNRLATGSLTYTTLQNKDVYEANSFAMSGSVSGKFGDQSTAKPGAQAKAAGVDATPSASAGVGSDSGSQTSTTVSGISAGALTITDAAKQAATGKTADQALVDIATNVTTDAAANQAGALTQAWNGETLMKQVQAQTQITQAFSAQAPKFVAEYAAKQELALQKELAKKPNDPELLAELDKWGEGGTYRVALHTLSGALSGGVGGALGAIGVASAAKPLNEMQATMSTVLQEQGMSEAGANAAVSALAQGAALGIGAVAGGTSGAATALAVDTNNRQLHPIELKWVGTSAKDFAAVLSDKYGRPVSELDAMRLLTYAGETDVDKDNQNVVSNILFGPGYMQETQMLLDAKKYIVQNAKGTFVDEAGKTQKLFVATGQDRINPVMYAEYKNNAAYRDFYWTVTSTNLLPSNPTAQEKAVYDARESARLVAGGKNILFSLGPAVIGVGIQAGRTALSSQLGSKAEMVPPVQAAPEVITAAGKIEPLPKN